MCYLLNFPYLSPPFWLINAERDSPQTESTQNGILQVPYVTSTRNDRKSKPIYGIDSLSLLFINLAVSKTEFLKI